MLNFGRLQCTAGVAAQSMVRVQMYATPLRQRIFSTKTLPAGCNVIDHLATVHEDDNERAQTARTLKGLGVQQTSDLNFVNEGDLIGAGISVVDARKILLPSTTTSTELAAQGPIEVYVKSEDPTSPKETLEAAAAAGLVRGQRSAGVIVASSILGGCFLSFGGMMFAQLAGGTPLLQASAPGLHSLMSAAVFPIGLSMIVFTKTDLLTSNFFYQVLPFLTHPKHPDATVNSMLKVSRPSENFLPGYIVIMLSLVIYWSFYLQVWWLSFLGNFVGSFAIATCASTLAFSGGSYAAWITVRGHISAEYPSHILLQNMHTDQSFLCMCMCGRRWQSKSVVCRSSLQ